MTHGNYKEYEYSGPVKVFDRTVHQKWIATTYAPSEQKARSNFMYQYKKEHRMSPGTKISLPGKITMLD